jgi:AraC-like DNA-binding protein
MQYLKEIINQERLSIIDDSGKNLLSPIISLLYIDHGWEANTDMSDFIHKHDYWQLEIVTSGTIDLVINKETHHIEDRCFYLIPPGTDHKIKYKNPRETWSIKFAADNFKGNFSGIMLPNDTIGTYEYCDLLIKFFKNHKKIIPAIYPFIRYWLTGLLPICYESINYPPQPAWLTKIRDTIIINSGHYESLDEIAKTTKYSRIYLSTLFKKHTGMNLKQFIDNERAIIAKRKLLYSNKNVTRVAEDMGFSDVFSFSRFFKRVTGLSPTHFLEKYYNSK